MLIFWENTIYINCHHQCRLQALDFAQTCEHSITFKKFLSASTLTSFAWSRDEAGSRLVQWLTWFGVAIMKILTVVKLRGQKYYPYKASGSGAIINCLWLELPYLEQISWSKMFLSWRSSNVKVSGRHNHFAKLFHNVKGYICLPKIKYSLRLHVRAWTILWLNCLAGY